jgi:hypothetical protein
VKVSKRRFIQPGTTRLDLSEGDWIEVKTELDYGEQQQLRIASMQPLALERDMSLENLQIQLNPFLLRQKLIELYLTDWSFRDEEDRPVPLSRTTLLSLDPETVDEMEAAINAHAAAVKAAKNGHGASR